MSNRVGQGRGGGGGEGGGGAREGERRTEEDGSDKDAVAREDVGDRLGNLRVVDEDEDERRGRWEANEEDKVSDEGSDRSTASGGRAGEVRDEVRGVRRTAGMVRHEWAVRTNERSGNLNLDFLSPLKYPFEYFRVRKRHKYLRLYLGWPGRVEFHFFRLEPGRAPPRPWLSSCSLSLPAPPNYVDLL